MDEGTKDTDDSQIANEIQGTSGIIKPENRPTHPLEASPPSPPSPQFQVDETLCVKASNTNNLLYSQSIQQKITPPACNNILTKLYNNAIEINRSKDIQEYSTAAIAVYKYTVKSEPGRTKPGISTNTNDDGELEKAASHTSHTSTDCSGIFDDQKNTERISLRHSAAALVSTNDDFEDVEIDSSDNSSRSSSTNGS